MKKKYKSVCLIVLLLIGGVRLAAIDEVTLFRVFLTDGTAAVSYTHLTLPTNREV